MEKLLTSLIHLLLTVVFTEIPSFVVSYSVSAAVHSCVACGAAVLRLFKWSKSIHKLRGAVLCAGEGAAQFLERAFFAVKDSLFPRC